MNNHGIRKVDVDKVPESMQKWLQAIHVVQLSHKRWKSPRSRSTLYHLNKATEGCAERHIRTALIAAVDNAIVSNNLFLGTPPIQAQGSLIRSAIEAASSVIWLLQPGTHEEAVRRVALIELKSLREFHNFKGQLDGKEHKEQRRRIVEWASVQGVDLSDMNGRRPDSRYSYSTVIKFAEQHLAITDLFGMWEILSGLAHGLNWATEAATIRYIDGSGGQARRNVYLLANKELLTSWQVITCFVLEASLTMWNVAANKKAESPFPTRPEPLRASSGVQSIVPSVLKW